MKYKVVRENSVKELQETVQALLDDGWELHGDLIVVTDSRGPTMIYYREMVKYEDSDAQWEIVNVVERELEEIFNAN